MSLALCVGATGFVFYRSADSVWLVDRVPPEYLRPVEAKIRLVLNGTGRC